MTLYFAEWATHLGLTQADIHSQITRDGHQCSVSWLNKVWLGKTVPRVDSAKRIADAMGLTLGHLERPPN